jgi:hypothetical protein
MTIITFPRGFRQRPSPQISLCSGCGSHFRARQPYHRLCFVCFGWARAGYHSARAAEFLRATERSR